MALERQQAFRTAIIDHLSYSRLISQESEIWLTPFESLDQINGRWAHLVPIFSLYPSPSQQPQQNVDLTVPPLDNSTTIFRFSPHRNHPADFTEEIRSAACSFFAGWHRTT